jgi:hypothetical protein
MAHSHSSSSRSCGACGGSYSPPSPQPQPYDPCGTAMVPTKPKEASCGCGKRGGACSCKTGRKKAPAPRNYQRADCPTFVISCETKQAVRECARTALCDFMRCLSETLCPDGKFDIERLSGNDQMRTDLINCVGQLACSFIHCLPDALCPEPCEPAAPVDCLPCGYAVEVLR